MLKTSFRYTEIDSSSQRRGRSKVGSSLIENAAFLCFFLKVSLKEQCTFTDMHSCLPQCCKQWEAPLSSLLPANLSSPQVLNSWVMPTGMKSVCSSSATTAASEVTQIHYVFVWKRALNCICLSFSQHIFTQSVVPRKVHSCPLAPTVPLAGLRP